MSVSVSKIDMMQQGDLLDTESDSDRSFSVLSEPTELSLSSGTATPRQRAVAVGLHHNIFCSACMLAIEEVRYFCANCVNYNLCESCEEQSLLIHNPLHIFFKVKVPICSTKYLPQPVLERNIYNGKSTLSENWPPDEPASNSSDSTIGKDTRLAKLLNRLDLSSADRRRIILLYNRHRLSRQRSSSSSTSSPCSSGESSSTCSSADCREPCRKLRRRHRGARGKQNIDQADNQTVGSSSRKPLTPPEAAAPTDSRGVGLFDLSCLHDFSLHLPSCNGEDGGAMMSAAAVPAPATIQSDLEVKSDSSAANPGCEDGTDATWVLVDDDSSPPAADSHQQQEPGYEPLIQLDETVALDQQLIDIHTDDVAMTSTPDEQLDQQQLLVDVCVDDKLEEKQENQSSAVTTTVLTEQDTFDMLLTESFPSGIITIAKKGADFMCNVIRNFDLIGDEDPLHTISEQVNDSTTLAGDRITSNVSPSNDPTESDKELCVIAESSTAPSSHPLPQSRAPIPQPKLWTPQLAKVPKLNLTMPPSSGLPLPLRKQWQPGDPPSHLYQYESERSMQQLVEMGFCDRGRNRQLLREYGDDVNRVISRLVEETAGHGGR